MFFMNYNLCSNGLIVTIDQTFSDECHLKNINFMTILLLFVNFPLHNVLRCFYQSNSLLATFGIHPAFYHVFRMYEAKFI